MPLVDGITIPDFWHDALVDLQKTDPKAILAGGCIRDLWYGVEPKDLDFFTAGPFPSWFDPQDSGMDYDGMQYVVAVGGYKIESRDVNVVQVEDIEPIAILETFDLGFCQIGYDGKSIIRTPAFDWDFKYNIITLRQINRYRRSIRRYARINQRYNLDLAIPQLDGGLNANPR